MTQFRPSFLYACALHLPVQSHNSDPDSDLNPHSDPDLDSDPDQASDLASDTLLDQNQWFMDPFVQKSCAQAVQRMEQLISKPFLPLIAEKVLKTAMMALRTAMKEEMPQYMLRAPQLRQTFHMENSWPTWRRGGQRQETD